MTLDQRCWEMRLEMTQMLLLLHISAHLCAVFLENERALEYLYLGLAACMYVCVCGCGWWTKPYWCVCVLPLYLIVWVLYSLMYVYPHCPVQRLLCVWVCGCWLYSRLLTLSDFCLWFSHSCSDGNKGLFIVWYITFLQRFVSLKLRPSFLTKQPELVLLSNVLFTDCSDVVFNTKSLCNRVQLGCSFQNNENVKMFQEG